MSDTKFDIEQEFIYDKLIAEGSDIISDRKEALDAVCEDWPALGICSEELRSDKKVCYNAVRSLGDNFKFVSKTLRNDENFVLSLLDSGWIDEILEFIPNELRNNVEFYKKAVKKIFEECDDEYCHLVKYAGEEVKKDRKFAEFVLKNKGDEYEYFDDSIKNDEYFKSLALAGGASFEDIGVNSFNDEKSALNYIKTLTQYGYKDTSKIEKISKTLLQDVKFVKKAVKTNAVFYLYLPVDMQDNGDVAIEIVKQGVDYLRWLNPKLKNDKDFMLKAMDINIKSLNYVTDILLNPDFMFEAIKKNANAVEYVPLKLKINKEFLEKVATLGDEVREKWNKINVKKI